MLFIYSRKPQIVMILFWGVAMAAMFAYAAGNDLPFFRQEAAQTGQAKAQVGQPPSLREQGAPGVSEGAMDSMRIPVRPPADDMEEEFAAAQASPPPPPVSRPATSVAPGGAATASVSRGRGHIVQLGLHFRENGMALVIEGDSALPVRQFVLAGPDRLVVDLPGSWRDLKAPAVPDNNLVRAVRLGRYGDADRLVLDLKTRLESHRIIRINDKKVEVLFGAF
ncbi:MAG: AMIN domain-containing protein [Deltaproteobacteria bacterium]|nr:AMIN domain-containing protein [Deltaproteobacteria bacterium]